MTTNDITPMDEQAVADFSQLLSDAMHIDDDRMHQQMARILELKPLVDEYKRLWDGVKSSLALQDNVLDPVVDGEHGRVAYLKEKKGAASIDIASMAKHPEHEAHILDLARTGLLSVALTPLRALKNKTAWADAALKYEMPAGSTYELHVEEVR